MDAVRKLSWVTPSTARSQNQSRNEVSPTVGNERKSHKLHQPGSDFTGLLRRNIKSAPSQSRIPGEETSVTYYADSRLLRLLDDAEAFTSKAVQLRLPLIIDGCWETHQALEKIPSILGSIRVLLASNANIQLLDNKQKELLEILDKINLNFLTDLHVEEESLKLANLVIEYSDKLFPSMKPPDHRRLFYNRNLPPELIGRVLVLDASLEWYSILSDPCCITTSIEGQDRLNWWVTKCSEQGIDSDELLFQFVKENLLWNTEFIDKSILARGLKAKLRDVFKRADDRYKTSGANFGDWLVSEFGELAINLNALLLSNKGVVSESIRTCPKEQLGFLLYIAVYFQLTLFCELLSSSGASEELLKKPDNKGRFLLHQAHFFLKPALIERYQLSDQLKQSIPGVGLFCHHRNCEFSENNLVFFKAVGQYYLQEYILEAKNKGSSFWLNAILSYLPHFPTLLKDCDESRLKTVAIFKRTADDNSGVDIFSRIAPFVPCRNTRQEIGLLNTLHQSGCKIPVLLEFADKLKLSAQACRWLISKVLHDSAWSHHLLYLFNLETTKFYELRLVLIRCQSFCLETEVSKKFEQALESFTSRILTNNQGSLTPVPDVMNELTAAGIYGRTVYFKKNSRGVLRLKFQKKNEKLCTLLREAPAVNFLQDAQKKSKEKPDTGIPLLSKLPIPEGVFKLDNVHQWLEKSRLTAEEQKLLLSSITIDKDDSCWVYAMYTEDDTYHHYAHESGTQEIEQRSKDGILIASRDCGELIKTGLIPMHLIDMLHFAQHHRSWEFLNNRTPLVGGLEDWNASATDNPNVSQAPYGLRDAKNIVAMTEIPMGQDAINLEEPVLQKHALVINEVGKLTCALVILMARLNTHHYDYRNKPLFKENCGNTEEHLSAIIQGVFSPVSGDQAISSWMKNARELGILQSAAKQTVFYCETGENPAWIEYMRKGQLPLDIHCTREHSIRSRPFTSGLKATPKTRGTDLYDGQYLPMQHLIALIYLALAETAAAKVDNQL